MSTQEDIDQYAAGFKKRMQERRAIFESERINLLAKVRPAGPALKAFGAKEVILFGSILRPRFFDMASSEARIASFKYIKGFWQGKKYFLIITDLGESS